MATGNIAKERGGRANRRVEGRERGEEMLLIPQQKREDDREKVTGARTRRWRKETQ